MNIWEKQRKNGKDKYESKLLNFYFQKERIYSIKYLKK
jgi:hypothetical protein